MAFDAGKVVEALDWSFRPFLDISGTVPEPTDDEIRKTNAQLRDITLAVTGEDFDPDDRRAAMTAFAKLSEGDLEKFSEEQIDAMAILTKDSPTREQLAACPPRVRGKFMSWLLTEINSPEG